MTPGGKGPVCGVDVDDTSPCSTGPPGRLIWSWWELAGLLRLRGRPTAAR